jgi:hypothetical protein
MDGANAQVAKFVAVASHGSLFLRIVTSEYCYHVIVYLSCIHNNIYL